MYKERWEIQAGCMRVMENANCRWSAVLNNNCKGLTCNFAFSKRNKRIRAHAIFKNKKNNHNFVYFTKVLHNTNIQFKGRSQIYSSKKQLYPSIDWIIMRFINQLKLLYKIAARLLNRCNQEKDDTKYWKKKLTVALNKQKTMSW